MITIVRDSINNGFVPGGGGGQQEGRFNLHYLCGMQEETDPGVVVAIRNIGYQQPSGDAVPTGGIYVRLQEPALSGGSENANHVIPIYDSRAVAPADQEPTFNKAGCCIPVPRLNRSNTKNDGLGLSWWLDVTIDNIATVGTIIVSFDKVRLEP